MVIQTLKIFFRQNSHENLVFTGSNQADMFLWMPKEHLYVLVYLVTVMHSMQAGYMEKAQKYTDKALMQIEKLQSEFFIVSLITFKNLICF